MEKSKFLNLNLSDWLKGLIMAVIVPCLVVLQQSLESEQIVLNWKIIATSALAGGVGYLLKNLFTPSGETDVSAKLVGKRPDER